MYKTNSMYVPYSDPGRESYTVDGLPTLKIQTLAQDGIREHRRSKTSPMFLRRKIARHKRSNIQSLVVPKINYVQILLEEEEEEAKCLSQTHNDDFSDFSFKPVLIWKPGYGTNSPPKQSPKLVTDQEAGPAATSSGIQASHEGSKSRIIMRKTNLTDTLPPFKHRMKV